MFSHEAHMKKMEEGIQEAIAKMEANDVPEAIDILKGLYQEEESEEKAMGKNNPKEEKEESPFRKELRSKIEK